MAKEIKSFGFQQFQISRHPNTLYPCVFWKSSKKAAAKGVDVNITVDILKHMYSIVLLVTGDGDYFPIIVESITRSGGIGMASIFLSHNHADKPFARRLAEDLGELGIHVWIDEAEIQIGDSLIEKIREGIDSVEYVGVILSRHSTTSVWVKKEVDIAMNQEIEGKRVKVLPLLIDDCDLPGFLKGKLYADFRSPESYQNEFPKLARRLGVTNPSVTERRAETAGERPVLDRLPSKPGFSCPNCGHEEQLGARFCVICGFDCKSK